MKRLETKRSPCAAGATARSGSSLAHGLDWQHFRGDWTTSGAQEIYDPGHRVEVTWCLPGEDPVTA
jgi:hypothetical protein